MMQALKKRSIVLIATAGLLLFVLLLLFWESKIKLHNVGRQVSEHCSFLVEQDGEEVELKLWHDATDDIYYLFVPSYAKSSDVKISHKKGGNLYIDGEEYSTGDILRGVKNREEYSLLISGIKQKLRFQMIQNGGVATMYLDLASGDMEYLKADRENEDSANLTLFKENGELDYKGRVDTVKGHGNSSWSLTKKKPLSLKLSEKADLLGMGKAKKWLLLNNYNESTNLANQLVYEFAEDVGLEYSPDCQLVDVYTNGTYYGMYLLSEKNEIAENRVDVTKPSNQTGSSYLVTMDLLGRVKKKRDSYVRTDGEYVMRIESPSSASDGVKADVLSDFQTVENALYSKDGIDPETKKSWKEMIDMDSWVKKYMIEEIFESADAVKLSQYFYTTGEEDSLIYAGPVWDFNASFGNPHGDLVIQNPNCLMANREWLFIGHYHNWFYYLYQDEEFFDKICEFYESEFEPLLQKLADEKMVEMKDKIQLSAEANFLRWFAHNENYTSVDQDFQVMQQFLKDRIQFLHSAWVDKEEYCHITVRMYRYSKYLNYAVKKGETFDESQLPTPEKKDDYQDFVGWYDRKTKEKFDFSKPITKDYDLYGGWDGKTVNIKKGSD